MTDRTGAPKDHSHDEYFVLEGSGPDRRLIRYHEDAEAARTHALASGGTLLRGRTEVVWASLETIPLNVDDAY
ncbi:MAG: hypothetical protein EOL89_01385 [Actinobacteria bacterium]|nr:hypothetical protein [Actinomycetota bacterium]